MAPYDGEERRHEYPCTELKVLETRFDIYEKNSIVRHSDIKEYFGDMSNKIDSLSGFKLKTIGIAIGISSLVTFAGSLLTLFFLFKGLNP